MTTEYDQFLDAWRATGRTDADLAHLLATHIDGDSMTDDPKDADDGELPDIKNDPVPEDDAAVDHEPPQNPGG